MQSGHCTKKLGSALEHVVYEMFMLHRLCFGGYFDRASLIDEKETGVKNVAQSAFIESSVIHIRALKSFFEAHPHGSKLDGEKAYEDDITAADFEFPRQMIGFNKKTVDRINKEIAHISWYRVGLTLEEKLWDFSAVTPPLFLVCRKFLEYVKSRSSVMACASTDTVAQIEFLLAEFSRTDIAFGAFADGGTSATVSTVVNEPRQNNVQIKPIRSEMA